MCGAILLPLASAKTTNLMGNATRSLKFLLFVICCGVFGGIRFVLEVGELHMNWDASDASPLGKLVCWFYPPNIQRKNQANQAWNQWFQNSLGHFCPTKTFANSIRGPISPFLKKNALIPFVGWRKSPWNMWYQLNGPNERSVEFFHTSSKGPEKKPRIPHSWKPKNGWDFWWVSKISRKKLVTIVGFQHIFLGATRWGK